MAREALNTPAEIPQELDRWNWGAFFLNWIWGIGNSTFIALLAFIPIVNIIVMIVLGLRGSRWAWQNRYWRDAEHFRKTQRRWAIAGLIVWIVVIGGAVATIISVPFAMKSSEAYQISMETLRANPEVQNALGDNIDSSFWVSGKVEVQAGGTGQAQLGIPLKGDKGEGNAIAVAIRTGGNWDMRVLIVRVDGSDAPIVLINKDNLPVPNSAIGI
ncbi:cytochrome c oxidase assembly factor Coa1 family protein [Mesorhizobium sp. SB112]|uniref:cytochrome c oxidase assembly factor Coa1 family protein n=1 Tax=Mesorhizobium sp. SB112 TaxID=3151853 RepID=UPI003266A5B6